MGETEEEGGQSEEDKEPPDLGESLEQGEGLPHFQEQSILEPEMSRKCYIIWI